MGFEGLLSLVGMSTAIVPFPETARCQDGFDQRGVRAVYPNPLVTLSQLYSVQLLSLLLVYTVLL